MIIGFSIMFIMFIVLIAVVVHLWHDADRPTRNSLIDIHHKLSNMSSDTRKDIQKLTDAITRALPPVKVTKVTHVKYRIYGYNHYRGDPKHYLCVSKDYDTLEKAEEVIDEIKTLIELKQPIKIATRNGFHVFGSHTAHELSFQVRPHEITETFEEETQ